MLYMVAGIVRVPLGVAWIFARMTNPGSIFTLVVLVFTMALSAPQTIRDTRAIRVSDDKTAGLDR